MVHVTMDMRSTELEISIKVLLNHLAQSIMEILVVSVCDVNVYLFFMLTKLVAVQRLLQRWTLGC